LVGSMVDDGADFPGGDVSGCPGLSPAMAITEGHGTILLRTDNEACEWKWLSVREIDPTVTTALRESGRPEGPREERIGPDRLQQGRLDAAGRRPRGKASPIRAERPTRARRDRR
jgi:hypothetical protein